jgi:hypothetical protein
VLAFNFRAVLAGADGCDWKSMTPSKRLTGSVGSSSDNDYWFTHVSDVDQKGKIHSYVYRIENEHPKNYLPVEWKEAKIGFSRIAPKTCSTNSLETSLPEKENPSASLRYGPTGQISKQAPLFLPDQSRESAPELEKPLKSRIAASLIVGNSVHSLDLEFAAQFKGSQVVHTVTNRGGQEELFKIPNLSRVLEKLTRSTRSDAKSQWAIKDGYFVAPANGEAQESMYQFEGLVHFRDEPVSIEIFSKEGKIIAAGQIVLYLPEEK